MKLKFLIFAMMVAAMGPSREAPPPVDTSFPPPKSPEDAAPDVTESPPRPELTLYEAHEVNPGAFMWKSRPMVVFADTPNDPAFIEQMEELRGLPSILIERDVVVITDTSPEDASEWRNMLHPNGFSLVLFGKDGQIKLRKPFPSDVRELSRAIDKFPLRRQEIGRAGLGR